MSSQIVAANARKWDDNTLYEFETKRQAVVTNNATAVPGPTYTLGLADVGQFLKVAAATTITLPNDATAGWSGAEEVEIYQVGAGAVTMTTTGNTIRGAAPTWAIGIRGRLKRVGVNEWTW